MSFFMLLSSSLIHSVDRNECASLSMKCLFFFFYRQYQSYIRGLNAYERHKKFVRDYGIHLGIPFLLVFIVLSRKQ